MVEPVGQEDAKTASLAGKLYSDAVEEAQEPQNSANSATVGQYLRQVELAALLGYLGHRDGVDRDHGVGRRRIAHAARADDVDALHAVGVGGLRSGLREGGRGEGGQHRAAVQAEQDGAADRGQFQGEAPGEN